MSSLAYTRDTADLPKYDVEEKQITEKEWGSKFVTAVLKYKIMIDSRIDLNMKAALKIEKEKITNLRPRAIVRFSVLTDKKKERTRIGIIRKRRWAKLTVYTCDPGLGKYIITLRSEHLDWLRYQKKLAERWLAKIEKKIRRRSKRIFSFIHEVKQKLKEWSGSESDFHQKKIEISEKYNITKREFMNLEKNYFPILNKAEPKTFSSNSGT